MATEPRMVTMKEFRETFPNLKEPVQVIRVRGNVEILGTWVPKQNGAAPKTT
jgi:hypothetical protein